MSSTVLKEEIDKFSKDAGHWWDPKGPFAPLHRMNPARMTYIRQQICAHFGLSQTDLRPFEKLEILDIGCGGGLACEPLARLGAKMTGIDADPVSIDVAKEHAMQSGLNISYEMKAAENIKKTYDIVLALEIIEHVADPAQFVQTCAKLVKPGGMIIFSTLNRTPKSFALGIVAAEYILNWVPRGTHNWKSFIKPSELTRFIRAANLAPENISGVVFNPLKGDFEVSNRDIDVNYFISAVKTA
jgi:2-polyprenyl-6-hydroxyphenyl methylase/3-demethylubiquinone-9 3-methyltransferase